jgi:hypothetical protein
MKIEDPKAINPLCLNCQNKCKQKARVKIIRCANFREIENPSERTESALKSIRV